MFTAQIHGCGKTLMNVSHIPRFARKMLPRYTAIGLLFFILSRPQRAQITSKKLLECFNDKCDKILSETEHISHSSLFFHPHKDISTIYS